MIEALLCSFCGQPYEISWLYTNNDCPHCGAFIDEADIMNVTKTPQLKDCDSSSNIQLVVNQLCKDLEIHLLLAFTAHYMAFVHNIWLFVNEFKKGVEPNDRVDVKDKIKYIDQAIDFLYDEGCNIADAIETPEMITRSKFPIINEKTSDQKSASYYYNEMTSSYVIAQEILRKCISAHVLFHKAISSPYFTQIKENENIGYHEKVSFMKAALTAMKECGMGK